MRTDQLITQLAGGLRPVQRLPAPTLRAAFWLLAVGVICALVVGLTSNVHLFLERMSRERLAIEWAATLLTGVTAVLAAFVLAVPGRSRAWLWLPALPLVVWLGASSAGCLGHAGEQAATSAAVGESAHCFAFLLLTSVPVAVALFWMLRRAHPTAAVPVLVAGLLATAAIAATLLQFYHPFDITWIDFGMHAAAILVIFVVGSAARSRLLST